MSGRIQVAVLTVLWASCVAPSTGGAAQIDLATTTCATYENHILKSEAPAAGADPINTVMWLLGFSIARSGEHTMYGNAISAFGFALDGACKDNPARSLLDAVTSVKPKRDNPMELKTLSCASYEKRHAALVKSDPESADTLLMWSYGYSIGQSGRRIFDTEGLRSFGATLDGECAKHPDGSLFDALLAATPATAPRRPKAKPN